VTKKIVIQKSTRSSSMRPASRDCELCTRAGGSVIWRDANCRVVLVRDPDYAGYCRVIWNTHVREMTDLSPAQRAHCMRVVFAVERALRDVLAPDKINLASFGNMAPHLHWHVIPRFAGDAHFPNPVWGKRHRPRNTTPLRPHSNWRAMLARNLAVHL
jgi:diadenosine tetraphosphate (Ap4A) HIT family hydrolase